MIMSARKTTHRYTPDRIEELGTNEIFVFGSNLQGTHCGGAARIALNKFGAIWGQGVGLQGKSYAIPTMQGGVETIKPYVDEFIIFAKEHKELLFYVSRIGCGIAGFKDEEIAPLFTEAKNVDNIVLPEKFVDVLSQLFSMNIPNHLKVKVHGQTATLVDMLIELNKEHHFNSPEEALACLGKYLDHLRTDGDMVAFNCSIRSLWSCCCDCFPNGKLDIQLLKRSLDHIPYQGIESVYKDYVIEKTIKLIEMMNEFRRYTNPKELAEDFRLATGGVNHCGPQNSWYYFNFSSPSGINYIREHFVQYLVNFWEEFAPTGTLDNAKFRNFMIERHLHGIQKYGLDAVIKRNYKPDSTCHPDVFVPYRGGAGPIYVQDQDSRKWIKSCGEGKGPNASDCYMEMHCIRQLLEKDDNYQFIENGYWNSYYVPVKDYSLPVYQLNGKLDFSSQEDKIKFIDNLIGHTSNRKKENIFHRMMRKLHLK